MARLDGADGDAGVGALASHTARPWYGTQNGETIMPPLPQPKALLFFNETLALLEGPADEFPELACRRAVRDAHTLLASADAVGQRYLYTLISVLEERLDHPKEALEAAFCAVKLDSENPETLMAMGRQLGHVGMHDHALEYFRLAEVHSVKGSSDWMTATSNQALAHHQLGAVEESRRVYLAAVAAQRDEEARGTLHLAHAAAFLGLPGDAVELLARYVAATTHVKRGDQPAMVLIVPALDELRAVFRKFPALERTVSEAQAAELQPVPDDMAFPAERVLPPEAWRRFEALAQG